jgi:uncharacterized alpha-E superfamily protein
VIPLLSRHAEATFWFARYVERAQSLARVMEVATSFQRGRADERSWAWIIAIYADEENFYKTYSEATPENVIRFYLNDLDNLGSMPAAVRSARENARSLRPLISTDMWYQLNGFYHRVLAMGEADFSEMRLSRTCDAIKHGCYAQIGVAESTLYRDESWPFFRLGLMLERIDQTSRLLDVRFARAATGAAQGQELDQDFGFWTILLRSASAYHAFRRVDLHGANPDKVARFLIFNARFSRSIAFCAGEAQSMLGQLRSGHRLRAGAPLLEQIEIFIDGLEAASRDPKLIPRLHEFNDWVQLRIIALNSELGYCFFGYPRTDAGQDKSVPGWSPPQTQTQMTG